MTACSVASRFSACANTNRPVALDDLRRHLLATVGRQAVHEHRVSGRSAHQLIVHLKAREVLDALLLLCVLAHRDPDVGVDRLHTGDRVVDIAADADAPSVAMSDLCACTVIAVSGS